MFDVTRFWHRGFLEFVGMVLFGISFILSKGFTDDSNALPSYATLACGWLLLGLANQGATPFGRAWRRLQFGIAAFLGLAITSDLLSISSPFSDLTTRRLEAVGVVVGVLVLVVPVPVYLVRELLRPTSEDFRMIEATHKEDRRREREKRSSKTV